MNATEYPATPANVEFSRNFADIFASATEADRGRMTRSSEQGFGYLSSGFDSVAASNASAAMCHFYRAEKVSQQDAPSAAVIAYHVSLATRFADRALA